MGCGPSRSQLQFIFDELDFLYRFKTLDLNEGIRLKTRMEEKLCRMLTQFKKDPKKYDLELSFIKRNPGKVVSLMENFHALIKTYERALSDDSDPRFKILNYINPRWPRYANISLNNYLRDSLDILKNTYGFKSPDEVLPIIIV